jgi:hypothetical protein
MKQAVKSDGKNIGIRKASPVLIVAVRGIIGSRKKTRVSFQAEAGKYTFEYIIK